MGSDGAGETVHAWHVDEREYRRHEQRRGRRHAFERLDPRRTALVVVDLVPFFARENPYCRGIVPHVNRLAAATRRTGGVVAWVLPGDPGPSPAYEELLGPEVAATYRASGGSGPLRDRLWPEVTAGADDLYVEKTAASAFFPGRCRAGRAAGGAGCGHGRGDRDRDQRLRRVHRPRREHPGLPRGARRGRVRGGASDRAHNATLHTVYRSFGDVRTTAEVEALLEAGAATSDVARSLA